MSRPITSSLLTSPVPEPPTTQRQGMNVILQDTQTLQEIEVKDTPVFNFLNFGTGLQYPVFGLKEENDATVLSRKAGCKTCSEKRKFEVGISLGCHDVLRAALKTKVVEPFHSIG